MFDCLNDQMITFLSAAEDWWLVTVRGPGRISTTPRCSLLLSVSDSDLTHCLQLQNPLISVLDSWVPVSISQSLIYLLMECLLGLGGKISKKSISDVLLFSAPLCLSPLTQCLQLRIPCSDSASALSSDNEPSWSFTEPGEGLYYNLWIFANHITKPPVDYNLCGLVSYF